MESLEGRSRGGPLGHGYGGSPSETYFKESLSLATRFYHQSRFSPLLREVPVGRYRILAARRISFCESGILIYLLIYFSVFVNCALVQSAQLLFTREDVGEREGVHTRKESRVCTELIANGAKRSM